jgi:hemerythrin-like metal-binding protein
MSNPSARQLLGRNHEVGHDAIDSDHQAMASCWNRTINCDRIQFEFLIARLKKLMRNHFDHEAALMEQAGGSLCECHRREHEVLLALCDQAAVMSRKNCRAAQSLLRNKLPPLVREHIICMDQLAALFINSNGGTARANIPAAE